jgi:DNA-binding transcriptional LysR family regulator
VRITPLGEVVLAHGRDLLAKAETLADAVDRFRAGNGRIDIGTFQGVSRLILPTVVRRLLGEHPGCDIRLSEVGPEDPRIADLDLLFHYGRIDGDVEHVKLLDEPYLLVAGADTFPDGPVRVNLLDGAPMVAWPPNHHQRWLERALASNGARPRIVFRTTGHETIVSMVRAGIGSAVLPWLALHGSDAWSDDQLSIHQLRPSPTSTWYLYWPAGRTQSPLAARAVDIAVETANELAKQM